MASVSVTTDAEVDQLIADVRRMMRELEQAAESGKDATGREPLVAATQARRWLDTLHRFADYAAECEPRARDHNTGKRR